MEEFAGGRCARWSTCGTRLVMPLPCAPGARRTHEVVLLGCPSRLAGRGVSAQVGTGWDTLPCLENASDAVGVARRAASLKNSENTPGVEPARRSPRATIQRDAY